MVTLGPALILIFYIWKFKEIQEFETQRRYLKALNNKKTRFIELRQIEQRKYYKIQALFNKYAIFKQHNPFQNVLTQILFYIRRFAICLALILLLGTFAQWAVYATTCFFILLRNFEIHPYRTKWLQFTHYFHEIILIIIIALLPLFEVVEDTYDRFIIGWVVNILVFLDVFITIIFIFTILFTKLYRKGKIMREHMRQNNQTVSIFRQEQHNVTRDHLNTHRLDISNKNQDEDDDQYAYHGEHIKVSEGPNSQLKINDFSNNDMTTIDNNATQKSKKPISLIGTQIFLKSDIDAGFQTSRQNALGKLTDKNKESKDAKMMKNNNIKKQVNQAYGLDKANAAKKKQKSVFEIPRFSDDGLQLQQSSDQNPNNLGQSTARPDNLKNLKTISLKPQANPSGSDPSRYKQAYKKEQIQTLPFSDSDDQIWDNDDQIKRKKSNQPSSIVYGQQKQNQDRHKPNKMENEFKERGKVINYEQNQPKSYRQVNPINTKQNLHANNQNPYIDNQLSSNDEDQEDHIGIQAQKAALKNNKINDKNIDYSSNDEDSNDNNNKDEDKKNNLSQKKQQRPQNKSIVLPKMLKIGAHGQDDDYASEDNDSNFSDYQRIQDQNPRNQQKARAHDKNDHTSEPIEHYPNQNQSISKKSMNRPSIANKIAEPYNGQDQYLNQRQNNNNRANDLMNSNQQNQLESKNQNDQNIGQRIKKNIQKNNPQNSQMPIFQSIPYESSSLEDSLSQQPGEDNDQNENINAFSQYLNNNQNNNLDDNDDKDLDDKYEAYNFS